MMGSMELKPAERNTDTMKDVERNLSKESCREKPAERGNGCEKGEIKQNHVGHMFLQQA